MDYFSQQLLAFRRIYACRIPCATTIKQLQTLLKKRLWKRLNLEKNF